MTALDDLEPEAHDLIAEVFGVAMQRVNQRRIALDHVDGFDGTGHHHWRHRVREGVWARLLAKEFDERLAAGDEAATCAAECLTKGAGHDVDLAEHAEVFVSAAASLAQDSSGVRVVDE